VDKLNSEVTPVECWGKAGDIVFWHHRLAHMAGHNYTDKMRQAVLADFWTTELDQFRTTPAQGDMWRDWSEEVQLSGGHYSDELAAQQRV
jgi:ectoine hydroxylase-related dioxygenase (phytanoyl-CoA dioxygenase family)